MKSYSSIDINCITPSIRKEDLSVITLSKAYVLPSKITLKGPKWGLGGVLDEDKKYVSESGFYSEWISFGGKYDIGDKEPVYLLEEVIWFGFFEEHWGHFLIDFISRMWYILKDYQNQKIVYISRYSEMEGNFKEFMKYLGVTEDRLIKINEVTQFDRIIIPEYAFTEKKYSPLYIEIFDKVISNSNYHLSRTIKNNEKVYFNRSNFLNSKQKEFGEKFVQDVFLENGYKGISPEALSLRDQIAIWNYASEIACLNGTIPLNIAFCRKNELKLIVLNKAPIFHQNLINYLAVFKHFNTFLIDAFYMKFGKLAKSLGNGPFFLYNSQELQNFTKDYGINNAGRSGSFYHLKAFCFLFQNKYFNIYKFIDKFQKVKRMIYSKSRTKK